MLEDQVFPRNEEKNCRIQRGAHNKDKTFVTISKQLFRNPKLSIKAKGLMGYLLSLPDDWVTHPRHIAKALGIGKDLMYSLLKELIENGYASKSQVKDPNHRFTCVEYFFYEDPIEIKEKIAVSEKPCPAFPDTENQTLQKKDYTHKRSLEKKEPSLKVPPEPAPKVAEMEGGSSEKGMAAEMVKALEEANPQFKKPKTLDHFVTQIDLMKRLDKREDKVIMQVFRWAIADSFWCDKLFKPNPAKYLRDKFEQLYMKMIAKPPKKERKFAPCSDDALALESMRKMRETAI